ncbi:hypothetical protein [Mesomycoplasma hyopneumoniae]|uniref:hypothetical protein n=1 Tax=Mesomycoplasma hyopneumoniae TaxID=2099 RepID=UPI002804F8D2|nr:hypothetical protein [Mesomycoplasma hyopneumoniae]
MKKWLFSYVLVINFLVSCGGNSVKIEFSPPNSMPSFQPDDKFKKDLYRLELTSRNYSYNKFKNKFSNFFNEIKSQNNTEFPFACANNARTCLDEGEITYIVIKKLVKLKILNFIPVAKIPLPDNLPAQQVSFIKMAHQFDDQNKKLELELEFGHFHSSQPHIIGQQSFKINFLAD